MMAGLTPDTLSERWLRDLGWTVDQSWRQTGPIKHDLFGFADQFAFTAGIWLMVQSTTVDHIAARREKVLANVNALAWKRASADNLIFVLGWKRTPDHMTVKLLDIQLQDTELVAHQVEDPLAFADVRDK